MSLACPRRLHRQRIAGLCPMHQVGGIRDLDMRPRVSALGTIRPVQAIVIPQQSGVWKVSVDDWVSVRAFLRETAAHRKQADCPK